MLLRVAAELTRYLAAHDRKFRSYRLPATAPGHFFQPNTFLVAAGKKKQQNQKPEAKTHTKDCLQFGAT